MTLAPGPNERKVSGYVDMLDESVHTVDDIDIGDIEAVSRDFVVVKRGFVNVHYYYIPLAKVEGWDGNVLWLKITEEEVKERYERNIAPDPNRYFIKDYPYYMTSYYPTLTMIPSRYIARAYPKETSSREVSRTYQCELCNSQFKDEEELSNHVEKNHS